MTLRSTEVDRAELVARLLRERGIARDEATSRSGVTSAPLTSGQRGIWLHHRLFPEGCAYNSFVAFSVEGPLDPIALELAVRDLQQRHEVLRSTLSEVDGVPTQRVLPRPSLDLAVVDLPPDEDTSRWIGRFASRGFDLSAAPPCRVALLRSGDRVALLVNVHHVAIDAWSVPIFLDELSAFYAARVRGAGHELPPLPIQFCDFALREERALARGELDADVEHWRRVLDGFAPFALPGDRPRDPSTSERAAGVETIQIDADQRAALEKLAAGSGTSVFAVFLAAWGAVLHEASGRAEVTVCTPVANRAGPGVERSIGFFANLVPLRLAQQATWRDGIRVVGDAIAGALTHQAVPLDVVVERLGIRRRAPRHPISDVLFAVHDFPLERMQLHGCSLTLVPARALGARFELELHVTRAGDGLEVVAVHDAAVFEPSTIRRLLARYRAAITAMLEDPSAPPLAPSRPRRTGTETSIAARVEAQIRATPDRVGAVSGGAQLTYAAIGRRADALAARLQREGVGPEAIVGVCMDRSLDLVVAVLAIVKAGGAYLGLDPAHPEGHLAAIVRGAAPALVLASPGTADHVPFARTLVVGGPADASSPASPRRVRRHPASLVYVTYTSGSTGEPKGVMMNDGALADLLAWQEEACALPPGSRTLQFTSLGFDLSYQDLLATLASGGTVVVVDEERRRDPDELARFIVRSGVHRAFIATVALEQLARAFARLGETASLTHVVTAGEQLRATADLKAMFDVLGGCALVNEYGPSETHAVTAYRLPDDPASWIGAPPIGTPIPGVDIRLLGAAMSRCQAGDTGEIHVGGACVGRGYLGRARTTAERFVPDPFADVAGARLYRTGDLARLDLDDRLSFVGRVDRRVKLSGHAVDPDAIEAILAAHPAIASVAVQVVGEGASDRHLVAFWSPAAATVTDTELRAWANERLPRALVPTFVALERMPLNVNGKVDRARLVAPRVRPVQPAALPEDPVEAAMIAIWAEVLERDAIGGDDDFFVLGGHSLLATRVIAHVEELFDVRLPLRTMFAARTPRAMAEALSAAAPDRDALYAAARHVVVLALEDDAPRAEDG